MLCYAVIGYDSSGKEIGWKGVENIDIFGKDHDDDGGSGDDHDYYFLSAQWLSTHTHDQTYLTSPSLFISLLQASRRLPMCRPAPATGTSALRGGLRDIPTIEQV